MKSSPEMKQIYTGIQHQLSNMIPEKWESIYLYASVVKQLNNLERWEMYFYYIPTGILKKNPINVYEIPMKFNVDEDEYLGLVENLCNTIKKLRIEYKNSYQKDWSNVVIAIKDEQFLVEFNNDNLSKSKYSSQDRHLIFKHKYLNIPIQSFSKKEREIIQNFMEYDDYKLVYDRYFESIPKEGVHNYIEYEKDGNNVEDIYATTIYDNINKKKTFSELIRNKLKRNELDKNVSDKHELYKNNLKEKDVLVDYNENFLDDCMEQPKIQILNDKW